LWEKLFADGKQKTLKSTRTHNSMKRATLSDYTKKTLGSGNLKKAVMLPPEEHIHEWLACNTVDFFNELSLLYGICVEDAPKYKEPGTGFPPGFEYRWQGKAKKDPLKVSGPEYVDYVMSWIEDQLDNPAIFPDLESQPFPSDFDEYVKDIFKKMFRIFAIMYHCHFETIEKMEAAAHLNTCFKHFMYFVFEFKLIEDDKELAALKGPVERLSKEWTGSVA